MRIAFIGCVKFSAAALAALLDHPEAELVGVITRASAGFNADFADLGPIAQSARIPCYKVQGNDQDAMLAHLEAWRADVVYCFGWSYLLDARILTLPALGVVGFHPAALPANRGRHPIIWTLALGLEQTATTFFRMDEGADSGPIISQRYLTVTKDDDAGSLYRRITASALQQIDSFTTQLASGDFELVPQDPAQASYWRRRTSADGLIDWRMPAQGIVNLVRALAPPYPGADCAGGGDKAKIWRARVHDGMVPGNHEPGKVLRADATGLLVKCGTGAVLLVQHEIDPLPAEGSYL